ncbi:short chain dehydrogenase reductase [Grosmannia clavigera kw1407]|uniref:Short chain dehydrogenase reductase n=1 Tax=Grosmannia clavigera (strain kw1407 / UAMH 11150) TaxID=655863 RepID=F0XEK2_GROCL|nr:short chain dehydrogenase reductase [Grosmannia clavigera kw1407]EFX03703.1 short chain dehydrogenase reductase [Grosmannia clavigera kw1407]
MSLQAASLFRVDGLVAVITGGGSGLGLTMARALALNGAQRVFVLGRRRAVLDAAVAEVNAEAEEACRASGSVSDGPLVAIVCDVTDKTSLQAAVNVVTADPVAGGRPVDNAALRRRLFDDVAMADVTAIFHVNVTAALFTMYAFLELLDAGNRSAVACGTYGAPAGPPSMTNPRAHPRIQSQVVFTSSIAGYTRSSLSAPAYVGSKAAVLQLAKQAAGVLAPYAIRVNALAPGIFPSELTSEMIVNRQPEDEPLDHPGFQPARRFGCDSDMAGTILYLASPAGSFCNGLVLLVDGGRTGVLPASY